MRSIGLRAFIALELPSDEILGRLVALQRDLAQLGGDVKLVEKQNLHFTVRFLGEITDEQAAEARTRLGSLTLNGGEVTVMGVGAFPTVTRPSVVWVGVALEDRALITQIAEVTIAALEGIGEKDERGFQPHLTLARVRSGRNREAISSFIRQNADRSFGRVRLNEIKLKSSVLTPKGPIYSDVGVYILK